MKLYFMNDRLRPMIRRNTPGSRCFAWELRSLQGDSTVNFIFFSGKRRSVAAPSIPHKLTHWCTCTCVTRLRVLHYPEPCTLRLRSAKGDGGWFIDRSRKKRFCVSRLAIIAKPIGCYPSTLFEPVFLFVLFYVWRVIVAFPLLVEWRYKDYERPDENEDLTEDLSFKIPPSERAIATWQF